MSLSKFFILILNFFVFQLEALNRDYGSNCTDDHFYWNYYDSYCRYHLPQRFNEIDAGLLNLIPAHGPKCRNCHDPSIYLGYVDPVFSKYKSHLKRQLEYFSRHPDCICLWPEYLNESARISDTAYTLFQELITTTELLTLIQDCDEQEEFIENWGCCLSEHGLTVAFIAQQFLFSDYYKVCLDIEKYAASNYAERDIAKIKDKLEDILENLYPKFFTLYTACQKKHPNPEITQEIQFMKLLVNDISVFDNTTFSSITSSATKDYCDISLDINKNDISIKQYSTPLLLGDSKKESSEDIDIFLEQGTLLNNLLLYKEAIQSLTRAIELNPYNRNAYIERAMAYFETNQYSLALKDYELAKKLTIVPPFKNPYTTTMGIMYTPENIIEFSRGLVLGTTEGIKISGTEFIPSIFSCYRGVLHGLWAFVCSPAEVSKEMLLTAYAIGEFISMHKSNEYLHFIVPELKELSLAWDELDEYSKGHKIGYILGKYGTDIFVPIGILKGIKKVRALKRANVMLTLENCAASKVRQEKIVAESINRSLLRESIIKEAAKKGRILTKSSNAQYHIMQPKHAWDKVIKLSGNTEEDFKKVLALLEENALYSESYFLRSKRFSNNKIVRADYQKQINGYDIHAVFETYIETNHTFLQDAWVIIK